ncbi:MAG: alpha/beta hydrolase, partial [Bacteroidota bacterium]
MDSLKGIFISAMETEKLDADFKDLNTASLNYSFDRMLLRYPRNHSNFTGNKTQLSEEAFQGMVSEVDQLKYKELDYYKRFTRTWLDQQIERALVNPDTTNTFLGAVKTNKALELIDNTFKHSELVEYWSFEMIKAHIEEYTWINGKKYLKQLKATCSTPAFCTEIEQYENELLTDREGHEILVYKTVKGRQLEVHIFKPADFDPNTTYATLGAFHGGGWASGHADWTFDSAKRVTDWGMIGIAVEYRLSNWADVTPLEAVLDAQDFMVWLRENAEAIGVDPQRIVLKGVSAGGHIVNALSVIPEFQVEASQPNALILLSPAIDTKDDYFYSLVKDTSHTTLLSPLSNLGSAVAAPTTLILQGKTDRLTPTTFVETYQGKMDELGYPCEVTLYDNCGHIFTPSHLDDRGFPQPDPVIMEKSFQRQKVFLTNLGYIN